MRFQSTLPTRGSDYARFTPAGITRKFQSTLPTRGSDISASENGKRQHRFQSTLPTRGGDAGKKYFLILSSISIHAPHEGERLATPRPPPTRTPNFNPRSPRGGATLRRTVIYSVSVTDFNPRSPRGGATLALLYYTGMRYGISIHAPHEGERPQLFLRRRRDCGISIHAPHEGERLPLSPLLLSPTKISIHAPHEGERRIQRQLKNA